MCSETLPSTYYILSDKSSLPFYSTSNGYNKWNVQQMFLLMYISSLKHPSRATQVQLRVPIGILDLDKVGAGLGTGLIR